MAHHNFNPEFLTQERRLWKEQLEQLEHRFGATGQFPEGKLDENDEGEICFGVAARGGKVLLDFGKPVHSLGMLPTQARELAESLAEKAEQAEAER